MHSKTSVQQSKEHSSTVQALLWRSIFRQLDEKRPHTRLAAVPRHPAASTLSWHVQCEPSDHTAPQQAYLLACMLLGCLCCDHLLHGPLHLGLRLLLDAGHVLQVLLTPQAPATTSDSITNDQYTQAG